MGYVLRFEVQSDYLTGFDIQKVGSSTALEYWIPAERLDEFNNKIIEKIEIISTYRPQS